MNKKTYQTQIKRVYRAFYERPKTMLEVANETGILRGNVCYFVRDFRKQKRIETIRKGKCPLTKHPAQFLSTNPKYFKPVLQTELFTTKICEV